MKTKYFIIAALIFIVTCVYVGMNTTQVAVTPQIEEVDSLRLELKEIDKYYQIEIMKKKDSLFNAYNNKTNTEQAE